MAEPRNLRACVVQTACGVFSQECGQVQPDANLGFAGKKSLVLIRLR